MTFPHVFTLHAACLTLLVVIVAPTALPSPPNKMDAATRSAVIDVLRQDAADGIQGSAAARDQDMALRFWQEEINNYSTTAEDYRMAMSAARAIHSDRDVMAAAAEEEARAADDRRMAVQLAGGPRAAKAQGYNPNKRQRVAPPTLRVNIRRVECVACTENTPEADAIRTSCSHSYCRTCVTKLFDDSLRDETLFPPRCCRNPIHLDLVQQFLDSAFTTRFEEKLVERQDTRRTYCAVPTCSKYLRASDTGRRTLGPASRFCEECNVWTCEGCKKAHTPGSPCPEDEEVLRMGRQAGWKQCAKCRNLVELTVGCNHITYVIIPSSTNKAC